MIFNEDHIDDYASKGVNCSKKNSTATDGTWTYNGSVVDCGHSAVCYEILPGSVTLYRLFGHVGTWPNGVYTCCIEGAVLVLEYINQMPYKLSFQTVSYKTKLTCLMIICTLYIYVYT